MSRNRMKNIGPKLRKNKHPKGVVSLKIERPKKKEKEINLEEEGIILV